MSIYKTAATFNRYTAGLMVHFLTMLCLPSNNQVCDNLFKKFFESYEEFQDLYEFTLLELKMNIDLFSATYSNFKLVLQSKNDYKYSTFFDNNLNTFHLIIDNSSFLSSYYSEDSFDFSIQSFIS